MTLIGGVEEGSSGSTISLPDFSNAYQRFGSVLVRPEGAVSAGMTQELVLGSGISVDFSVQDRAVEREVGSGRLPHVRSRMFPKGNLAADSWDTWWHSFLQGGTSQFLSGRPRKLRIVDLFSSAGGLSLGVREAARALGFNFEVELAADLDRDALATYELNFAPARVANSSVRSLVQFQVIGLGDEAHLSGMPTAVGQAADLRDIDLIVGGPPCQGHSSLNNHTRGNDVRNDLYLTLPALALATQAKALIIENVPRVVRDRQRVVATTESVLRNAGYSVTSGVLSARDLGWPQTRSRHFLIASRDAPVIAIDQARLSLQREARPVWWAIGDLEGVVPGDDLLHTTPKLSRENQDRIQWLFENAAYELPNHIRPDCHKDGHTYPSVYGRIHKDSPAPTITTGFQTPGRGRFVHPTQQRVLTVREAARIQGFPDSFAFRAASGPLTRAMLQKWIGDAVPSILGFTAGILALEALLGQREI